MCRLFLKYQIKENRIFSSAQNLQHWYRFSLAACVAWCVTHRNNRPGNNREV